MESGEQSITLVGIGQFAITTVKYLSKMGEPVEYIDLQRVDATTLFLGKKKSPLVLVSGWPLLDLYESIGTLCHELDRPFAPLFVHGTLLQFGPILLPTGGGCWSCWIKRIGQHRSHLAGPVQPYPPVEAGSNLRPEGFAEPHALLAATWIAEMEAEITMRRLLSGSVRQFQMLQQTITQTIVIGVHNCTVCGLKLAPETRSIEKMVSALSGLWTVNHAASRDKCGGAR
jgi:bacteriocin biosynthesis cyclodehydratase domain-containing protein